MVREGEICKKLSFVVSSHIVLFFLKFNLFEGRGVFSASEMEHSRKKFVIQWTKLAELEVSPCGPSL